MDLLRLLGGCDLAGSDGPDRLVCNNDLAPVTDLLGDSAELAGDDLDGLAGFSLLERLSAAEYDAESTVKGGLGLGCDERVALLEDDTALAVAEDGPCDVAVLELGDGDLTREGAVWLVEDVLGSDFDAFAEVLAGKEEVEEWWCDDDFGVLVNVGLVQVLDDALDGVNRPVPVLC